MRACLPLPACLACIRTYRHIWTREFTRIYPFGTFRDPPIDDIRQLLVHSLEADPIDRRLAFLLSEAFRFFANITGVYARNKCVCNKCVCAYVYKHGRSNSVACASTHARARTRTGTQGRNILVGCVSSLSRGSPQLTAHMLNKRSCLGS